MLFTAQFTRQECGRPRSVKKPEAILMDLTLFFRYATTFTKEIISPKSRRDKRGQGGSSSWWMLSRSIWLPAPQHSINFDCMSNPRTAAALQRVASERTRKETKEAGKKKGYQTNICIPIKLIFFFKSLSYHSLLISDLAFRLDLVVLCSRSGPLFGGCKAANGAAAYWG